MSTVASRVASYSAMYGSGLTPDQIKKQAKFSTVILDAQYLLQNPSNIDDLRRANPSLKLGAYVQAAFCASAKGGYPLEIKNAVIATDGWVPDSARQQGWVNAEIDYTKPETVAAVCDVIVRNVIQSGKFDLLMLDSWAYLTFSPDQSWNAAWRAGFDEFARRMRGASNMPVIGNGGPGPGTHVNVNGWMRENFPLQNGRQGDSMALNWISNMQQNPWGQLGVMREAYRLPEESCLMWSAQQDEAATHQRMVFTLASALLTDHCKASSWRAEWIKDEPYRYKWWPEYDVPLGDAETPAIQYGGVWRRDYERCLVLCNPTGKGVSVYNLPTCKPPNGPGKRAWHVYAYSGMVMEKV